MHKGLQDGDSMNSEPLAAAEGGISRPVTPPVWAAFDLLATYRGGLVCTCSTYHSLASSLVIVRYVCLSVLLFIPPLSSHPFLFVFSLSLTHALWFCLCPSLHIELTHVIFLFSAILLITDLNIHGRRRQEPHLSWPGPDCDQCRARRSQTNTKKNTGSKCKFAKKDLQCSHTPNLVWMPRLVTITGHD